MNDSRLIRAVALLAISASLASCVNSNQRTPPDPAAVRYSISALLPTYVQDRVGWAEDIGLAFETLEISPTAQNICAVAAITEQESTFTVNPEVPNLPNIARREIESRAARFGVPKWGVKTALKFASSNGRTFEERLAKVRTEKDLSDFYEELVELVPLGRRLFGSMNPVRTGGPMQVSMAFAEAHKNDYPYPKSADIRAEVFTRRGGMYFGIAHLLDYPVSYDRMVYRFADFNAGHYASRNAAFQHAVARLSGRSLALDGDLVLYDKDAEGISETEAAIRRIAARIGMTNEQIREDLSHAREHNFERTKLYRRVFERADEMSGKELPRARMPQIRLQSAKITRKLTTEWFATRVDNRYRKCLARGSAPA